MPSSVTDFLHHVHAEKLKNPVKKKKKNPNNYPPSTGEEDNLSGGGGAAAAEEEDGEEDDSLSDRDNEHQLYLLHQHQQQLSEKLSAQLLRQQKLHSTVNRRNSDDQNADGTMVNLNPWERRNKRTYHDENLLMDYIIDMPVGENSENWNLVTNDELGNSYKNLLFRGNRKLMNHSCDFFRKPTGNPHVIRVRSKS